MADACAAFCFQLAELRRRLVYLCRELLSLALGPAQFGELLRVGLGDEAGKSGLRMLECPAQLIHPRAGRSCAGEGDLVVECVAEHVGDAGRLVRLSRRDGDRKLPGATIVTRCDRLGKSLAQPVLGLGHGHRLTGDDIGDDPDDRRTIDGKIAAATKVERAYDIVEVGLERSAAAAVLIVPSLAASTFNRVSALN